MKNLVVGIDVGGTNTAYAIVDEVGNIHGSGNFPTNKHPIFDDYLLSLEPVAKKYSSFISMKPSLAALFTIKQSYLEAAFDEIEKTYGGINKYLDKLDVDITHLRQLYTE